MTCEVNEMLRDIYATLFCWCLSAVGTLIEQLHEAWDVQSCLFTLKLVVQRKEWSCSLALHSAITAQVCGASRLRHRNRSWSRPLESMLVLGLYQHVSEPSQKRLSNAFIQRSVMPQRLSKRHLLFEFPLKKKKKKNCFVRYTCVPNRKTHTETVRYEYVYRFTPNIYDSLSLYEKATLFSTKKVFHRGKCGWATSNRWRGQTSPFWANYHFKYWLSVATNKSSDIKHGCSRGFCSLYSTRRRRLIYSGLGPHSSIELSFSQPNRISGED